MFPHVKWYLGKTTAIIIYLVSVRMYQKKTLLQRVLVVSPVHLADDGELAAILQGDRAGVVHESGQNEAEHPQNMELVARRQPDRLLRQYFSFREAFLEALSIEKLPWRDSLNPFP